MISVGKISNIGGLIFFLIDQIVGYFLFEGLQSPSKIANEYAHVFLILFVMNMALALTSQATSEYYLCGILFTVMGLWISFNPIRLHRLGLYDIEQSPVNASWLLKCSA